MEKAVQVRCRFLSMNEDGLIPGRSTPFPEILRSFQDGERGPMGSILETSTAVERPPVHIPRRVIAEES
jgi:hypothetical protein